MANKIKCTCGHSWDKSDSSKKDAMVCHICGKNNMKNGGWLDKFDAPEAQNGIEGTMGGLTDKGFNYNGAWGGPSMQMGGNLPGATGHMYARYNEGGAMPGDLDFSYPRTKGIPSEGPYAKKTMASAQKGISVSDNTRTKPIITDRPLGIVNRESVKSTEKQSYRMSPQEALLNKLKGVKLKESQDRLDKTAEKITAVSSFSPNPLISIPSAIGNFALGASELDLLGLFGSTPSSLNKIKQVGRRAPFFKAIGVADALSDIFEFTPSEDLPKKQNGGEMKFYQEGLDWKPRNISRDGSVTKDDNGYWNPENWGEPVEIGSNNITMQGVYEPLLGISDTGDVQYMEPGQDYKFKGKKVTEYPIAQEGIKTSANPYFKSAKERDAYRQRLKEVSEQALSVGSDEDLLIGTSYHNIDEGNNCINGVCGLNRKAGITYNKPTDVDRFLSGEKFAQAVAKGDEDYYQVDGNFQIGDHMMYRKKKGTASHNKIIYDSFVNDQGEKVYKVIDNAGGKQMKTDNYTESELKKMQLEGGGGYDKVNIYRPGYSIDKTLIEKERLERTSPEARKALADRAERIAWETSNNPGYKYSIRKDSEYYDDQPEGMQKFIEFANDDKKINKLVEKLGVDKGIIHDELLNTFGELGQENKWEDPMFGGNMAPSWLRKLGVKIPIENTIEKIFKPKSWSIGPGQIKFNNIDPELKKKFNIEKPRDLYDFEKIIPLMTAINVRNRKYMENQGDNLSTKLIGKPGVDASELEGGVGRWTPYMYRGKLSNPVSIANEEIAGSDLYGQELTDKRNSIIRDKASLFDKGSYASNVFENIDKNLERTLPGEYFYLPQEMQPIKITAKKKKKNGGWLEKYK